MINYFDHKGTRYAHNTTNDKFYLVLSLCELKAVKKPLLTKLQELNK